MLNPNNTGNTASDTAVANMTKLMETLKTNLEILLEYNKTDKLDLNYNDMEDEEDIVSDKHLWPTVYKTINTF
jgi:hypothetical protein